MFDNQVRKKMKAGEPTIGSFLGLCSIYVTELMANAGFDWLVIEMEHNGLSISEVERMMMAMNGTPCIPLVRVPSKDPLTIQRLLDCGAMGIVVPMIRTAEEARTVVAATRYPPEGTRGFGPLRASRFGADTADYYHGINENIITIFIIETKEAVENLEAIAMVPGVDGFALGQCDMSLSYGKDALLYKEHSEVNKACQKVLEVGKKYGIATGMNLLSIEQMMEEKANGHTLLAFGPDYHLLGSAARAGIAAFKDKTKN